MITSVANNLEQVSARSVRFIGNMLHVTLTDGREIGLPLEQTEWLHWLAQATPEQRANWSIEPGGYAIYWEDLDDGFEIVHALSLQPVA
jgi:hypothetical protein